MKSEILHALLFVFLLSLVSVFASESINSSSDEDGEEMTEVFKNPQETKETVPLKNDDGDDEENILSDAILKVPKYSVSGDNDDEMIQIEPINGQFEHVCDCKLKCGVIMVIPSISLVIFLIYKVITWAT